LLERLFPYLTETLEPLLRHRTSSLCSLLPLIFIPAPKIINTETMASSPPDQAAILKEVLDAVKTLQVNQVQLSSAVDAISGRVNVLAGMKEVRDIAIDSPSPHPVKKIDSIQNVNDDSHSDDVVPPSPSLPASAFSSSPGTSSPLSHARKPSVTSRIILT
jgi:hypothetical protein